MEQFGQKMPSSSTVTLDAACDLPSSVRVAEACDVPGSSAADAASSALSTLPLALYCSRAALTLSSTRGWRRWRHSGSPAVGSFPCVTRQESAPGRAPLQGGRGPQLQCGHLAVQSVCAWEPLHAGHGMLPS